MSRTLLAKDCHQEGGDLTFSSLGLNSRKEAKMAAKRLQGGIWGLRTSEGDRSHGPMESTWGIRMQLGCKGPHFTDEETEAEREKGIWP